MERERWLQLYALALDLGRSFPQGVRYSVAVIVSVYCWAVVHDRPVSWACQRKNWPGDLLPLRRLPSQATMSRRLHSQAVQALLGQMGERLNRQRPGQWVKAVDSKPLAVGPYSKDREARWGRATKLQFANGYKLHAVWDGRPLPAAWCLLPMNVHDAKAARLLIPQLKGGGYLLGDRSYDSNPLYDLAAQHDHQLLAPRKQPRAKRLGNYRHSPYRLRCIELLKTSFGQELLDEREQIERAFGGLTSFGGGLAPLPAWVRTLHRVELWLQAKLLINAVRILQRPLASA